MIFNRLNFHGHLRMSAVCKKWYNLVLNDILFMRAVKFNAKNLSGSHELLRSYKMVDLRGFQWKNGIGQNVQELLNSAETIDFGCISRNDLNHVMPMCKNLKEIGELYNMENGRGASTPLNFKHPLPTTISMFDHWEEFFECFDVITKISNFHVGNVPSDEFMTKYGAMINAVSIDLADLGALDFWARCEKLQLKFLLLLADSDNSSAELDWDTVRSFFEKQAPSLKTINFHLQRIDEFWFDPALMLLINLETVVVTFANDDVPQLNNMKVLPKLRCLMLTVVVKSAGECYELDIVELVTLTELFMESPSHIPAKRPKIRMKPQVLPMDAIGKITVSGFRVDGTSLAQIALTMPRLKMFAMVRILISGSNLPKKSRKSK
jgi:hypothetical protein